MPEPVVPPTSTCGPSRRRSMRWGPSLLTPTTATGGRPLVAEPPDGTMPHRSSTSAGVTCSRPSTTGSRTSAARSAPVPPASVRNGARARETRSDHHGPTRSRMKVRRVPSTSSTWRPFPASDSTPPQPWGRASRSGAATTTTAPEDRSSATVPMEALMTAPASGRTRRRRTACLPGAGPPPRSPIGRARLLGVAPGRHRWPWPPRCGGRTPGRSVRQSEDPAPRRVVRRDRHRQPAGGMAGAQLPDDVAEKP